MNELGLTTEAQRAHRGNSAGVVMRSQQQDDSLTRAIIGAAIDVHRSFGPGLLESTYESCLSRELSLRELNFSLCVLSASVVTPND